MAETPVSPSLSKPAEPGTCRTCTSRLMFPATQSGAVENRVSLVMVLTHKCPRVCSRYQSSLKERTTSIMAARFSGGASRGTSCAGAKT